jgi:YegS/Rv2252/BmrU family lipid kinase
MAKADKWFLVCNPIARSGQMEKRWPELQARLIAHKLDYDFQFTRANNHAIEITQEMIREGYRKIAVVGGDGTVNEVVNGIFTQKHTDPSGITFGLIPLGTANDWARTHRIPADFDKAVLLLKNGSNRQQDIGLATFQRDGITRRRYFNNVAGMSYDAFVVKYIEEHGNRNMNKLKYVYYILHCLFMFKLPEALIRYENREYKGNVYTINVGICKYNGGGLRLVPQAIPDDGKFALTFAKKLSKIQVVLNMYRFYTGTLGQMKQVVAINTGDIEVSDTGNEKIMLELDGEYMGHTPVKFQLIPKALQYIGS